MHSCTFAAWILIFLIPTLTTADPVTVKLHGSATLPCSERCSGVVRWTESRNPSDVLAECNQTSCRSVREGYQMIHDQYLKGDLSLTITDADLSKRARYTCDCDGTDLCDVQLKTEPVNSSLTIEPGKHLELKIDSPDPVEVIYHSTDTAGPSSGQTDPRTLCTVRIHELQCLDDYQHRVSLKSGLQLRGLTQSDSGVYTVRDSTTKEAFYIYRVTVDSTHRSGLQDKRTDPGPAGPGHTIPVWGTVLLAVLLVVCVTVGLVVLKYIRQRRENQRMRNEIRINEHKQEEVERLSPRSERSTDPMWQMTKHCI